MRFASRFFEANGIRLHAITAGDESRPLVILLHGFPEFWYGWHKQIDPLATRFYVVAPDQRGYNLSEKPAAIADYTLDVLASDVVALARACGRNRAFIVGHDWGGVIAWWTAAYYPETVERIVILNAPHPLAIRRLLRRSIGQLFRSWYAGFIQIPTIPEVLVQARDYAALVSAMRRSSRPETFTAGDFEQYRRAWEQPGALTSMMNYYRAFARRPQPGEGRLQAPTLILWGKKDVTLKPELAKLSARYCGRAEVRYFPNATHWLQHEEPEAVNAAILEFFG